MRRPIQTFLTSAIMCMGLTLISPAHATPQGQAPIIPDKFNQDNISALATDTSNGQKDNYFPTVQSVNPAHTIEKIITESKTYPNIVNCINNANNPNTTTKQSDVNDIHYCYDQIQKIESKDIHAIPPQYLSALSTTQPISYVFVKHEYNGTDTFYYITKSGYIFQDHEMSNSIIQDIIHQLYHNNIPVQSELPKSTFSIDTLFQWIENIGMIVFGAFMLAVLFLMQGEQMMKFFKSPAKRLLPNDIIPFDDIAGNAYIKNEMLEIAYAFKHPKSPAFQAIPSGILLAGPPGCGKTMIAAALAKESGIPFYHASGSDFVEMYVGLGPRRIQMMFNRIRNKHNYAILFIDEIDAIAQRRSSGGGDTARQEYDNTLNKMLQMMDGADNKRTNKRRRGKILVIAATNRAEILDPALLRPNRLERTVHFHLPPYQVREELATIQSKKYSFDTSLTPALLAQWTSGMSGADMDGVIRQAYLRTIRAQRKDITAQDVTEAIDLKIMGEPSEITLNEEDRIMTTWHEAAHALTMIVLQGAETVRRITIIPRGQSLGSVASVPRENQHTQSLNDLFAMLIMCLAGRAGEEALYKGDISKITTGATQDIQQASAIARGIIEQFGFAQDIGMVHHAYNPMDPSKNRHISEYTNAKIDQLIHALISTGYDAAKNILRDYDHTYNAIIHDLLERDTITGVEAAQHLPAHHVNMTKYYIPLMDTLRKTI